MRGEREHIKAILSGWSTTKDDPTSQVVKPLPLPRYFDLKQLKSGDAPRTRTEALGYAVTELLVRHGDRMFERQTKGGRQEYFAYREVQGAGQRRVAQIVTRAMFTADSRVSRSSRHLPTETSI